MREMGSAEMAGWMAFYNYEDELYEEARMRAELESDAISARDSVGR